MPGAAQWEPNVVFQKFTDLLALLKSVPGAPLHRYHFNIVVLFKEFTPELCSLAPFSHFFLITVLGVAAVVAVSPKKT